MIRLCRSVEVHMMYALQLHAPDVSAALSALHRSLADAGPLRMRGRSTLVRWVCDWACCPVLSLRPHFHADGGLPWQCKPKRQQRTESLSGAPATPALPPPDTQVGRASGGWVHDAAVCVLPDVLASARGWFAIRLLQAIAAEEQQEQPEVDAWLVLMGTPSIHLGAPLPCLADPCSSPCIQRQCALIIIHGFHHVWLATLRMCVKDHAQE